MLRQARIRASVRLAVLLATSIVVTGSASCGAFGFNPDVNIDTSIFKRDDFARFSLAGEWLITNDKGQTRRAIFDDNGDLVSFELPSDEVFEIGAGDSVDVLLTSFGAVSIVVQGMTTESGRTLVIHEFEGLFSDDGSMIRGTAMTVADDLSDNTECDCKETWTLVTE
ncbi:MAG: hypothetical protein IID36_13375 [Planctomycetes bacterium]|nr:hypothetical protein [Planctomycetota bacterium]